MTTAPITVARQVLDVLARHGATTVFGLPGVHNLAFWRSPEQPPTVVRHEQTAVYAADGWARTTGRLGAAVVTTGPGAANAVAAFGEAAASHSPVVLVASEIPQAARRDGRLRGVLHESRDQAALFAPLAKATFTPRSAAEVAAVVERAATTALSHPQGPVYVDVPADVLGEDAAPLPEPDPADERHSRPEGVDESAARSGSGALGDTAPGVAQIARRLSGARVAVWAGRGAVDAGDEVAALAAHLGAPVVTSFHGRGTPGELGVPPHEPEAARLVGDADVLLVVGGDLDGMNTRGWSMPRPPVLLAVDPAEPAEPPEWVPDAAATGDVAAILAALRDGVPKREQWWDGGVRAVVRERLAADPATAEAVALLDAVEGALAGVGDPVLVCDMAVAGYWAGGYASLHAPRRLAYPVGWGTLGFGLPAAVGAAAAGRPVLAVVGDGGLMMALGELATLVQERLPVVVLVVDDGGYGMLRYDQTRAGDPHVGVDLVTPDLVACAASFGMAATGVDAVAGLAAPLASALASGAPHLVRVPAVLTPPRTTSPRWHED